MRQASCDEHTDFVSPCLPCRVRRSQWQRRRYHAKRAGTWKPWAGLVPTAPVRRHVRGLLETMSFEDIARQSKQVDPEGRGVSSRAVRELMQAKRVRAHTASLVMKVGRVLPSRIDSCGTRRREEALMWMGWPRALIRQRALGWNTKSCPQFYGTVLQRTYLAMARFYDAHSHLPGPSKRVRATALRRGYAPPAAWDEHTIDNPRAKPAGMLRSSA